MDNQKERLKWLKMARIVWWLSWSALQVGMTEEMVIRYKIC